MHRGKEMLRVWPCNFFYSVICGTAVKAPPSTSSSVVKSVSQVARSDSGCSTARSHHVHWFEGWLGSWSRQVVEACYFNYRQLEAAAYLLGIHSCDYRFVWYAEVIVAACFRSFSSSCGS